MNNKRELYKHCLWWPARKNFRKLKEKQQQQQQKPHYRSTLENVLTQNPQSNYFIKIMLPNFQSLRCCNSKQKTTVDLTLS